MRGVCYLFVFAGGIFAALFVREALFANTFIVWSQRTASATYPSAMVVDDQFYTLLDRGFSRPTTQASSR